MQCTWAAACGFLERSVWVPLCPRVRGWLRNVVGGSSILGQHIRSLQAKAYISAFSVEGGIHVHVI